MRSFVVLVSTLIINFENGKLVATLQLVFSRRKKKLKQNCFGPFFFPRGSGKKQFWKNKFFILVF